MHNLEIIINLSSSGPFLPLDLGCTFYCTNIPDLFVPVPGHANRGRITPET